MTFTIIDIETTGLSKHYHKITEIAAVKLKNKKIVKTYQTLINPKVKIPGFITKLTGINNEMVKDSPTIKQILPSFIKFIKDDIFVAHNASFDYGFLEHNIKVHNKKEFNNQKLCTRKLANRLFPELQRKRLQDLCCHLNIKNKGAHRALSDVKATVGVFNHMLYLLNKQGLTNSKDILNFEKSPIKKKISK
jgi:DNA polymerase III subunit alpha, Gram-positive type